MTSDIIKYLCHRVFPEKWVFSFQKKNCVSHGKDWNWAEFPREMTLNKGPPRSFLYIYIYKKYIYMYRLNEIEWG